jgi:hypothetical protein
MCQVLSTRLKQVSFVTGYEIRCVAGRLVITKNTKYLKRISHRTDLLRALFKTVLSDLAICFIMSSYDEQIVCTDFVKSMETPTSVKFSAISLVIMRSVPLYKILKYFLSLSIIGMMNYFTLRSCRSNFA